MHFNRLSAKRRFGNQGEGDELGTNWHTHRENRRNSLNQHEAASNWKAGEIHKGTIISMFIIGLENRRG
jgi:hypothetical protein